MADDFNFWAIVIGVFGAAFVLGGVYGLIELADAFQNARYHRAHRDRINRRLGVFHDGGQ
jgi:multisubunit Na+/H+ antiporter MnhG subunit